MIFYTTAAALLILVLLIYWIHKRIQLNHWRRQLERGDIVQIYFEGNLYPAVIKHFINNGKRAKVRFITKNGRCVVMYIPLNLLKPTT